jgi:RNA polymerase sigma-70 factor, ECF subfamily
MVTILVVFGREKFPSLLTAQDRAAALHVESPPVGTQDEENDKGEVTRLLAGWRHGDAAALEALFPLVYVELRERAARAMARERQGLTLEPTALVHELFLKLDGGAAAGCNDRGHFYALAARTMRQVLVDRARRRSADKRGGNEERVGFTWAEGHVGEAAEGRWLDVLDVERALSRLERISERRARVVELRFFAGLEDTEIAAALGVSLSTVEREWRTARAYLKSLFTP